MRKGVAAFPSWRIARRPVTTLRIVKKPMTMYRFLGFLHAPCCPSLANEKLLGNGIPSVRTPGTLDRRAPD